jgi:hypothetical protein
MEAFFSTVESDVVNASPATRMRRRSCFDYLEVVHTSGVGIHRRAV